ncbi:MAG: hypothetical protein GY774_04710 [Planctomycetes bacterium]|nr:hypothetical protein [Planctomycetota bacterium]
MTWVKPLTTFTKVVEKDIQRKSKRLALQLLRGLIMASPKDTGRFINNWIVGLGRKDSTTLQSVDPGRTRAYARGLKQLKSMKKLTSVWLSNNLPYADKLNQGHSGQAPLNFVEREIKKVRK